MRGARRWRGTGGQTSAEFALILGAVTVGCIVVILFLSGALTDQFGSGDPLNRRGPFLPPSTVPELTFPTSIEQCKDGGWSDFPQYESEKMCIDQVKDLQP